MCQGVCSVYSSKNRCAVYDRQDLVSHFDDDLVGVTEGKQACERASSGHAVAPGIVHDDKIDTASGHCLEFVDGPGARRPDRATLHLKTN
jgi:hypothetical protein